METLGISPSTPKPTSRIRELFWPKIEDEVAANTAARNAMYASFFVAVTTAAFGLLGGQGWAVLIDSLLYAMVAIGVRQLSRFAAITGLLLYSLSWIVTLATMGLAGIVGHAIVFALMLGGVRAAAFAHGLKDEARDAIANPEMNTVGMSRVSLVLEELPRRAWPVIKTPFMVILTLLVAVNVLVLNLVFFGIPYIEAGGSMMPTIKVGDYAFVARKWISGEPRRGDVIAFAFPPDPRQIHTKRIVGMPGDRIKILNKRLWLNGIKLSEPYAGYFTDYIDPYRDNFPADSNFNNYDWAQEMLRDNVHEGEVVVPPGEYFVLGDNRDASLDSRYWGFVSKADLIGRPVLLLGKGKPEFLRYPLGK